jgi:molybdopterin-guanine dinucleotide biosynthesis protein A
VIRDEGDGPGEPADALLVVRDPEMECDEVERVVRRAVEHTHASLPVLAVVLIGGRSRRMGSPKHLLARDGRTLVERVVDAAQCYAAQVVLAGTGDVPASLAGLERLPDAPDVVGPMAGLLGAMRWRPGARRLALACDLALITPDAVAWLLEQGSPGSDAVMPVVSGKDRPEPLFAVYEPTAHPFLEAAAACGEFSLHRSIAEARVLRPEPPAELQEAWTNVNTSAEWRRLTRGPA